MATKSSKKTKSVAVNIPAPGTFMPPMSADENKGPKLETCDVGPFSLKGVKVDFAQFTEDQIQEMITWAKDNDAYVVEDKGLFSWRKESKRDWFILRWT